MLLSGACNGTFTFDTAPLVDAAASDASSADASNGDSAVDGSTAGDSSVELDPGTMCADAGPCAPGSKYCCAGSSGYTCNEIGADCNGLSIPCDDSSTCPEGRVCCAEGDPSDIHAVECQTICIGIVLCDPINTMCPLDLACGPFPGSGLPEGYMGCQ